MPATALGARCLPLPAKKRISNERHRNLVLLTRLQLTSVFESLNLPSSSSGAAAITERQDHRSRKSRITRGHVSRNGGKVLKPPGEGVAGVEAARHSRQATLPAILHMLTPAPCD